jgi:branched-chain amino acid transport system substrate-binding protein
VPAEQVEGLYSCLDYYQELSDPFSKELLNRYNKLFPGSAQFTAGSACSGLYRGMKLWEAAVREAASLDQAAVIKALDHAKIAQGPGGPAEMVPGQHHARMHMYIGQARAASACVLRRTAWACRPGLRNAQRCRRLTPGRYSMPTCRPGTPRCKD